METYLTFDHSPNLFIIINTWPKKEPRRPNKSAHCFSGIAEEVATVDVYT